MTEFDKQYLYDTLDKSKVSKETQKHSMAKEGHYYTNTNYYFGDYKITFTKYTPESKSTPLGHVCIYYGKKNRPLGSWNQTRIKDKYVYDMYIAVKNKYESKPYINPYKQHNPDTFSQILTENSEMIFPNNIPDKERNDIIRRLQVMFLKNIEPYYRK